MRNRVPHLSLLTQFSILSLLCVVALGAALVLVLRDQIHDRAAANSRGWLRTSRTTSPMST